MQGRAWQLAAGPGRVWRTCSGLDTCPDASRPGYESWRGQSDTLVIHHNGHQPCAGAARNTDCSDCTPNFDTAQDWLNQVGYDVMEVAMPLRESRRRVFSPLLLPL